MDHFSSGDWSAPRTYGRKYKYKAQRRDQFPALIVPFQNDANKGNTGDLQQLVTLLQCVMTNDPQTQKPAENMLLEMERRTGFIMLLFLIMNDGNTAVDVRNLAAICLKNCVIRYWWLDADFALQEVEKAFLVDRIVAFAINEPNAQIRAQLALAMAKMTRYEFAKRPDIIVPQLVDCVRSESSHSLPLLSQVIKELSTMQIAAAKKNFAQLSETLLPVICQFWSQHIEALMGALQAHGGQQNPEQAVAHAQNAVTCSKILRRIIVHGLKNIDQKKDVMLLLQLLLKSLTMLIQFRSECIKRNLRNVVFDNVERCIVFFMKIPGMVQVQHAIAFRSMLVPYLQFCTAQVAQNDPQSEHTLQLLVIRALLFLKNVAQCHLYEKPEETSGDRFEAHSFVFDEFFTPETLASLSKILISRYMILTENELDMWREEPEVFVMDQELDWNDTMKSAADQLFLVLLETFQEKLSPFIVQLVQHTFQETSGSLEKDKLILREACYSAVGWGSYYLYDKINFPEWFSSVLKHEIETRDQRYNIIRRRAAWLAGRWVERIDMETRCQVYEGLLVLASDTDIVLKLTSLSVLDDLIRDYEFSETKFEPYLDRFMQSIFSTVSQLKEEDSKLRIVTLLAGIVEKMGSKILPYTNSLINLISALWSQEDSTPLMRNAIIRTCKKLVEMLEDQSDKIHGLVLPLLHHSTDAGKNDFIYLGEDALELYRLMIQFATSYTEGLMHLYGNIIGIMQTSLEHLNICLNITEGYILLGKSQFLSQYATAIAEVFTSIIGNVKDRGTFACINVLDTLLTLFPQESPSAFAQPLSKILVELMLPEPDSSLSTLISTSYMCLFARILLHNRDVFSSIFHQFYQQHQQRYDQQQQLKNDGNIIGGPMRVLLEFLDKWIDESDHIISSFKRKISALAMLNLFPTTESVLLHRFPLIVNICVQVMYEMDESYLDLGGKVVLLGGKDNFDDDSDDEAGYMQERNEFDRKRMQMENDPVAKVDMHEATMFKLNEIKISLGEEPFSRLMQSVDTTIVRQLEQYPTRRQQQQQQKQKQQDNNSVGEQKQRNKKNKRRR